jgi:hypothetical protein
MFAANPQTSIEIEAIARLLAEAPVGGVVTYQQIEAATGRRIAECRIALLKARDAVEAQSGGLFGTVHKVGVKRLTAAEAPGIGADARRRMGKAARRTYKRLSTLKTNDIDITTRARIDAERSVMGAVSAMVKTGLRDRIEKASPTAPMPAAKVAELLGLS